MELQFKRLSDHKKVELKEYCETVISNFLEKNPHDKLKIYVGTDSQNHRGVTIFATVIVFHYGNHGGHVLFAKETKKRFPDTQSRLWQEVMYSIDTAVELKEKIGVQVNYIDLDLNPDPKYKSNEVLRAAIGMVESMGFEARVKSLGPYSAIMADVLCR